MKNVIVITGASSGIGKEFAVQLDKTEKADEIWVLARRLDRLEKLRGELKTKVVPVAADLSTAEGIAVYAEKLAAEKPNVTILANCSGFGKFGHIEKIPLEQELNMIDLNCKAPVAMIDRTLPYMERGGRIVNVASCAGFQPIPYINVYAASKSFLLSYSRALARELAYRGISVLAVCPFWTKTEFFDRAIEPSEKTVVVKYDVLYRPEDVVRQALKDMRKGKDISVYGKINRMQKFATKVLPHSLVMKIWMKKEKLDGTPEMRK